MSDEFARQRLLARIGDVNDFERPRPLVSVAEYFEGNDDPASIGYNLSVDDASPARFHRVLNGILDRDDVADVLVMVKDLEDPDGWPSSDEVLVITAVPPDTVASWLPEEIRPDTASFFETELEPPATERYDVPPGLRAVSLWWD